MFCATPKLAVPTLYLLQEVHGRTVTVLQHNGKVYAIDTACFHQGGPLGTEGDIEDINGVACLRCPWHGYRVYDWAHVQVCSSPLELHWLWLSGEPRHGGASAEKPFRPSV